MRKNRLVTTGVSILLLLGLGIGTATAKPIETKSSISVVSQLSSINISSSDWKYFAKKAAENGEEEYSYIASYYAAKAEGKQVYKERGIAGWAKKAAIIVLKYGVNKLPKWMRPYAGKVLSALETVDSVTEFAIASALMKQGLDGPTAVQVAQYTVLFLSTFGPL